MLGEKQLGQSSIPWCDIEFECTVLTTRQQLEVDSIPWHRNSGKASGFNDSITRTWKEVAVKFNDSTTHTRKQFSRQQALGVNDVRQQGLKHGKDLAVDIDLAKATVGVNIWHWLGVDNGNAGLETSSIPWMR